MKIANFIVSTLVIVLVFRVDRIVADPDGHERFWSVAHLFLKLVLPVFTETISEITPDSMRLSFEGNRLLDSVTMNPVPRKIVPQRPKAPFPFTIFAEFIRYYKKEADVPKDFVYIKPTKDNGYETLRSGLITSLIFIPQISKCGYSLQDAEDFDEKVKNGDMQLSELGIVCLESSHNPSKCHTSVPITDDCPRYLTEPPTTTFEPSTTIDYETSTVTEEVTESSDLIPIFPPYFDPQNNADNDNNDSEGDKLKSILNSFILDNDHRSHPSD